MPPEQNAEPLRVFLVDDEAPARDRLRILLGDIAEELPNVVVGEADNGLTALAGLETAPAEVVLADIRMPRMDGIELARHLGTLPLPPAVIFTTAFDQFAVQAFELSAIDYLLKPIRAERLARALAKARQSRPPPAATLAALHEGPRRYLSCHERGRLLLIPVDDLLYLKADLKYVAARTVAREYLLDESLTKLEEEFGERFIRLHRAVICARHAIAGFERAHDEEGEHWVALIRGVADKLPVSRRQWPLVKQFARELSG